MDPPPMSGLAKNARGRVRVRRRPRLRPLANVFAVAATDALEEDTGGVQAASTPRTASRVALRCFLPPPVALHASYGFVDIPHQSMLRNRALASLTVHQRCRGGRAGVLILAAARCRCSQSLGKKMTS